MKVTKRVRRTAKRLLRFCTTDALLDEGRARRVVHSLAQTRRRNRLPILRQFQRLVSLDHAAHTAVVESPVALAPDLQTKVRDDLSRLYGAGLSISWAQNPALIGGMRIKVASDVYDGSIRGRLTALEASL